MLRVLITVALLSTTAAACGQIEDPDPAPAAPTGYRIRHVQVGPDGAIQVLRDEPRAPTPAYAGDVETRRSALTAIRKSIACDPGEMAVFGLQSFDGDGYCIRFTQGPGASAVDLPWPIRSFDNAGSVEDGATAMHLCTNSLCTGGVRAGNFLACPGAWFDDFPGDPPRLYVKAYRSTCEF
jgi:hypothetical protein